MSEPALDAETYRKRGGLQCPMCESGQIEGGSVTIESGGASQEVRCLMCDARWVDNYDLTGYGDLRVDGLPVEVEEQADAAG